MEFRENDRLLGTAVSDRAGFFEWCIGNGEAKDKSATSNAVAFLTWGELRDRSVKLTIHARHDQFKEVAQRVVWDKGSVDVTLRIEPRVAP